MSNDIIPLSPPEITLLRPRRRLQRLVKVFAFLLLLLAVLAWFAPLIVARTDLRNRILRDVFSDVRGSTIAGGAKLSWFGPVELSDVTIADSTGRPALTATKVTSSRSLFDLLTKRDDLGTFTIDQPRLDVIVENGNTNIEQVIANYLTDDGKPSKPERLGLGIEVKNGQIRLTEGQETRTLDNFDLTLTVPRPRTEAVKLTASASTQSDTPGKLAADCQFLAGGKVHVIADQFAVGHLAPLIHCFAPDTTAEGKLGGNFTLAWGSDVEKRSTLNIDGWASASNVRLAGKSWLGPDVLKLEKVEAGKADSPMKLSLVGRSLSIDKADIVCDLGTATASGTFDPTANLDVILAQTGLTFKADIDIARLGTLMPRLLRVKEGTEFREGHVIFDLASVNTKNGPALQGKIDTSELKAVRNGKWIGWKNMLKVSFVGRLGEGKIPTFDNFELQSDFIAIHAAGVPNDFRASANISLDVLSAHLAEFVDLSGLSFKGSALVNVITKPRAGSGHTLDAKATFANVAILDGTKVGLQEASLTMTAWADFIIDNTGTIRVESGSADLRSGNDFLDIKLLEPIANVMSARTGRASLALIGDLDRWSKRAALVGGLPPSWLVRGDANASAEVALAADDIIVKKIDVNLTNAVLVGGGLNLDEPQLTVSGTMRLDRKSKAITFTDAKVNCPTINASLARIDITEYGLATTAVATADLARLQRTLGLQTDKTGADALGGKATGTLKLDASKLDQFAFTTTDLRIENFTLGTAKAPTWREPWIDVQADGTFETKADTLTFRSMKVSRDGLSATGKGYLARLSTDIGLDVDGSVTYDLAKLDTTLKSYLGKSAAAVGKDTKPFKIAGDLASGGKNVTVTVGGQPSTLTALHGNAAVGWQSLKAYGFDVGAAEVRGTIDKGVVSLTPIEATFGGGKARIEPTLALNPGSYDLSFAKGKIVDKARLTPAVLTEALGYALPAIANAAQADGVISFELEESRIPLVTPERGRMKGTLTIHEANVSAGPVMGALIGLLGVKGTTAKLVNEERVPIEYHDGRVHHRNFAITIDTVTVRTSGSVGLDGSLEMTVEVPLSEKIVGLIPLLNDRPRIKEALAKQIITIQVGGTVNRPKLDPQAFRTAFNKVIEGAMRDAARGTIDDVIKGGLDKLPFPFFPKK